MSFFFRNFAQNLAQTKKKYIMKIIVLTFLAVVNVVTFFLYGIDKRKAKRSKWRVQESTLLWWAVFGGSIGALLGMRVWHHKTQHKKFKYGVPAILIAQIAITIMIIIYLNQSWKM